MTLDCLEWWNKYTWSIQISLFTVEETDFVDNVLVTLAGDCTSCNFPNQLCTLDHSSGQVFFFCFFRALDGLVLHFGTIILLLWLLGLLYMAFVICD